MSSYLMNAATKKKTPQSQPIPGREKDMTRNNAGGFAFRADSFTRLERFLILGSEKNTYYCTEQKLTGENIDNVRACIQQDGERTVKTIVDISVAGRAPKNDPALYALALAASCAQPKTRQVALAALPKVARIGTHLFQFAQFIDAQRGWGPALRKAVAEWYLSKPADKLSYQLVKYQQRNGWSHRDLLRLAHLPGQNTELFRWVIGADTNARDLKTKTGSRAYPEAAGNLPVLIDAFERAKKADEKELIALIREHGLTREMIPTQFQKAPAVWEALLEKMPLTAMIRTLGRMGASGLLVPLSNASALVCRRLGDSEYLHRSRVHPIQCLSALLTYKTGHGLKGSLTWQAVPQVVDALDSAFYAAFANVQPTGKRFYLGVDVSGSMTGVQVAGIAGLTPNMGAAAMAMLIARTEPNYFIGGFSHKFVDLGISRSDRLDAAMQKCQRDFGGTDTSIAIEHALVNKYPVDCFVIITDGETWAGDRHTSQALESYRQKTAMDSKLVVINMVANRTSIADPQDLGSIDCVGFDASVPTLISGFLGAEAAAQTEEA